MTYSITLERGSDGSYSAWVHELPGCFARGATRDAAMAGVRTAIDEFRAWLRAAGEAVDDGETVVTVAGEVESAIEAEEDTEVLLASERTPLSDEEWAMLERWLSRSRARLLDSLAALPEEGIDPQTNRGERTARDLLVHIAFVELMYAAWTFDLRSRDGLADFLGWTRAVASERMRVLAQREDASLTQAEWSDAPRPEPWTARKAARRLVWHELLHLPEIEGDR